MSALTQAELSEALEIFRSKWWRCHRFGMRFSESLPAMPFDLAEWARNDAFEEYYRPGGHADLKVSRRLYEDSIAAIEAANAEHRSTTRKPPKGETLRRLLRERDGDDCWVCGGELGDNASIEHKVALANGGTWAFANLALAHPECNYSLGRLPVEAKAAVRDALSTRRALA